jgi:hypothetical protein
MIDFPSSPTNGQIFTSGGVNYTWSSAKSQWQASANGTYYIGTTQNYFARASASQTLTGISIDGNAVTAGGLAVATGTNNLANQIVRTDANGYIQAGYLNSGSGNEGNASSPARVWGTNGSDSYLRTYLTTSLVAGTATNTSGGTVNGNVLGVSNTTSTNGYGISLYNGAVAGQPTYGIFFGGTATFGTYGNVTADWATYFTMDSTANRGWVFRDTTNGNKASISNLGDLTLARSLGVGTPGSGTAGQIRATGSITASYSDKRLKTDIEVIDNALDKVNQLTGITFNQNEVADNLGLLEKERQVGVFAQDVLKVLPEAVKSAPFDMDENNNSKSGENYLTVQYERLIPLLIQSIKELNNQVEDLKTEIKELKGL